MTLYGEFIDAEDNRPEGYSGLFRGKVYDSDNRRNNEVEIDQSELSNHLHTQWQQRLPMTSKYSYQFRDEGDQTVIDFFLENKMPNPPDFHFEMGNNEQYVMKFRYLPQDGMKTTPVVNKTIKSIGKKKKRNGGKQKSKKNKEGRKGKSKKGGRKNNLSA
jgi:hypothetical protein